MDTWFELVPLSETGSLTLTFSVPFVTDTVLGCGSLDWLLVEVG
jgi:hypothetical protein